MSANPAKFYEKAYSEIVSVLRGAETAINAVEDFRAFRPKEARRRIFSGSLCAKASLTCTAVPKCRKKPMSDCSKHWPAWTTTAAWKS
jgi:hypothetical protein